MYGVNCYKVIPDEDFGGLRFKPITIQKKIIRIIRIKDIYEISLYRNIFYKQSNYLILAFGYKLIFSIY